MPFYLVTHTSLIEADNETHAAEKAVDLIRGDAPLMFSIKSDEETIKRITVAGKPADTDTHSVEDCGSFSEPALQPSSDIPEKAENASGEVRRPIRKNGPLLQLSLTIGVVVLLVVVFFTA
ncbi:hypothetical protein QO002_006061 [Pararhizobium capsulatum DSM 1112]|uniref:Uncharacterized protein n=1 Tax=Pararhizobium capsulatum DSM 1112 TaxID=1121113 RepID=A0ABU0C028_9HYPH|nr:hypothetical protein [Pararhizobium capsulatum]MDQ0323854.1 hypothetical protein [Pararhizobium capsulatum DSM 1112]